LYLAGAWGQRAPFDVQALMQVARIGDPQISPDGRTVAFTVQRVEIESNARPTQIWLSLWRAGSPGN
jgi:dipeptidyl aminopeptidase/acylaminoacyl peptidase